MAKKNFDAFINAAGKKPKPTPEEVEAMAKQLHQAAAVTPVVEAAPAATKLEAPVVKAVVAKPKKATSKMATAPVNSLRRGRSADPGEAPKEKVRITIDLAKDLYKRMKLAVVENETEISAYVRSLIENDLAGK